MPAQKQIYVDQVGYLQHAKKLAILPFAAEGFALCDAKTGQTMLTGALTGGRDDALYSGDTVYYADFTACTRPGSYVLRAGDVESFPFRIGAVRLDDIVNASVRCLYSQRCGCGLDPLYAKDYAHAPCHTQPATLWEDHSVMLDVSGGWHDAGDYGRHVTPAAVTLSHLLTAFLLYPDSFAATNNIPESGNGMPDLLNECRYELEWLLKMQNRHTGEVYHKVTSFVNADIVTPEKDNKPLILFPSSSMSTACFAACMAQAAFVYREYDQRFASVLLNAAVLAYGWLQSHPHFKGFKNPRGCNTGQYGDVDDVDERYWAAAEMFRATGDRQYESDARALLQRDFARCLFGWQTNGGLGTLALLLHDRTDPALKATLTEDWLEKADILLGHCRSNGYMLGLRTEILGWGSNMQVCAAAAMFQIAARLTGSTIYEEAALEQIHYLLGRNPVNTCFITGFGSNAPKNPYHRLTMLHPHTPIMPGWVIAGANGKPGDPESGRLFPPGTPPLKCYIDRWQCYSLNATANYWNSIAILALAYFGKQ